MGGYQVDMHGSSSAATASQRGNGSALLMKRAWDVAKSPIKSIFMLVIMMWMMGTGVNIFSIMLTGYGLWSPIKALISTKSAFEKFAHPEHSLLLPILVFIALTLAQLLLGVYRASRMGLLPTSADWLPGIVVSFSSEPPIGSIST